MLLGGLAGSEQERTTVSDQLEMLTEEEIPQPDPATRLTSRQVLDAVRTRHSAVEWIFLEEVRASTGWGSVTYDGNGRYRTGRGEKAVEQRLDAWALQLWSPGAILAYEVKVSRADYLREVKDPEKRLFAELVSSEFYFATPVRLIRPHELPAGCGLIEVYEDGRVRTRVKAEARTVAQAGWGFVGSLLRRQRRDGYLSGPGHRGQCRGMGYRTPETAWHEFTANADEWCVLEAGHNGECRRRKP